jgi:hypothetical protein
MATVSTVRTPKRNPGGQVDVLNIHEHDPGIALLGQHAAQRGRDQARRQNAGGHLVEQRLEQVVVRAVHHRQVHVGGGERAGDVETAEPADDDHPVVRTLLVGCAAVVGRYRLHHCLRTRPYSSSVARCRRHR